MARSIGAYESSINILRSDLDAAYVILKLSKGKMKDMRDALQSLQSQKPMLEKNATDLEVDKSELSIWKVRDHWVGL